MKLYFKYFKMHVKGELQYKMSFIMSFISQFFVFFGYYFTILCLFDKFSNIKGFTLYEVLLTFAIIQLGFSFCESFFKGIDHFDNLIIDGTFDKILLRPRNILIQVLEEEISLTKPDKAFFDYVLKDINLKNDEVIMLGDSLTSDIILIIAVSNIDVNWNIYKIITLIFMILSSILIFLGLFILMAAYCFVTIKGLEVRNVFTDGGKHMAQYPIGIFRKGIVIIFTFIIPYGFVNYYPLLYILGKKTSNLYVISPLITIIYLIPCIIIFYKGVKKYSGVGS